MPINQEQEKISDLVSSETQEFELLKGKTAKVGQITFDVIFWIEEKYGDFGTFMKAMDFSDGKMPKLSELVEILFNLLENKSDFADVRDFARHVPLTKGQEFMKIITTAISSSMPKPSTDDAPDQGDEKEGKE